MPHTVDGVQYMTIAEAVDFMGCSDGWVRMLLRDGRLKGRLIGKRLWLVSSVSAADAKASLSTRSGGKRHLAKRPAAKRKSAKKAANSRK